jgi:hypothetical protein
VVDVTLYLYLVAVGAIDPRFRAGEARATPHLFPEEEQEGEQEQEGEVVGMTIRDLGVPLQGGVAGGVVLVVFAAGDEPK